MNALWIFLGGGLGSLARWWASGFVAERFGQTFPWGTIIVLSVVLCLLGVWLGHVIALAVNTTRGS